ncbi:MAG TPA: extensin family protein [Caulobacteraceae bacterium]|jgi:hypothetical protein
MTPEPPQHRGRGPANALAELAVWAVIAGLAFLTVDAWAPAQHLPWKPLRLDDPIGAATSLKLARVAGDPVRCRAVLAEGGVRTADHPERSEGEFCALQDVVTVRGGTTPLRPGSPVMTCSAALSFALWERHSLQPAAREILGSEVAAIDHYGTYACRRIYGQGTGRPSEHAFANALDVAGFRLRDGRRITVAADWEDEGEEGRFLRSVRDGACRSFGAVLGPEYNAAHRDHLHLDRGRYRVCR